MKTLQLSLAFACLFTTIASAEDFVAHARVVKVVALANETSVSQDACPAAKPLENDLVATLRWDLCQAPEAHESEGYRVYYEWDDHIYERVVSWRPDTQVPIRVRLD